MGRLSTSSSLPGALSPKSGTTDSVLFTTPFTITSSTDYGFGAPVQFMPPMSEDVVALGINESNTTGSGLNMYGLWYGEVVNFYNLGNCLVDASGNMTFGTGANGGSGTAATMGGIWRLTPTRQLSALAGNTTSTGLDGTGAAASFNGALGTALASDGNYYISEQGLSRIRKLTPAGVVTTLAGNSNFNSSADGTGTNANFGSPRHLVFNAYDNCLYVYDSSTYKIRKITLAGVVTTVAGTGTSAYTNGNVGSSAIVGSGQLASDGVGGIYFTDNQTIRKIDTTTTSYTVTTLAGASGTAAHVDAPLGGNARFYGPWGMVWDATQQCLWVHDTGTATAQTSIRKVLPSGTTTTLMPASLNSTNGQFDGPATSLFAIGAGQSPLGIDPSGWIIQSDGSTGRLRKINTTDGRITHVGGHNTGTGIVGNLSTPAVTLATRNATVATVSLSTAGKQGWMPFPYPVRIPAGSKVWLSLTNASAATSVNGTVSLAWAPISMFQ